MKKITAILITITILSMSSVVSASSDEISDYIANEFNSHYNGMRRKAKGDKKKLAKLAKIRSKALKRIHTIDGMDAQPIAITAIKEMKKVVK